MMSAQDARDRRGEYAHTSENRRRAGRAIAEERRGRSVCRMRSGVRARKRKEPSEGGAEGRCMRRGRAHERAYACVCREGDTELTSQPSEGASRSGERVYALALALRPLTRQPRDTASACRASLVFASSSSSLLLLADEEGSREEERQRERGKRSQSRHRLHHSPIPDLPVSRRPPPPSSPHSALLSTRPASFNTPISPRHRFTRTRSTRDVG